MRGVVVAFVAVAVAVALVTMCLCWLLLLPRLTLVQSRHLLPLSLFALHCNNNKQPPNAVIFAIQSTRPTWKIRAIYACMKYSRVCVCVCATPCVSLSVAGSSCAAYSCSFSVPDPNRISEPSAMCPACPVVWHFNWRVTKNSTLVYFIGT